MQADLNTILETIPGIVIPAQIRRQLNDEQYAYLERMIFIRAEELGVSLANDPDDRWGDQREED